MISQENRLESLKAIREDLHGKLKPLRTQLANLNVSEGEYSQIIDDFNTLDAILEALQEQHIRVVVMGKVNAGKSSLANSLLKADVYQTDAIQGTAIKANGSIKLDKWEIHDTPGIMNNLADDEEAKENIRRAHVKILVIDDQPYEPELELFRWATQLMPGLPTVIFFNKYDKFHNQPRIDKERILEVIKSKMKPFVKNIETDIVYGSASLFDSDSESYKRQPPPKDLMDWLYNQADYTSTLVKVIDPANQALTNIESNVLQVREQVARRIVNEYAEGNATSALIPFSSVTIFPVRLNDMNLTICEIMGVPPEKMQSAESVSKVFWEGVWSAAKVEAFWSLAGLVLAPFTFGVSLAATVYGTIQEWNESQKRVLVLGEALIQWIKSGYPNISDGKAYLNKVKKKLESGNL
jgi:small GTP-binding protein